MYLTEANFTNMTLDITVVHPSSFNSHEEIKHLSPFRIQKTYLCMYVRMYHIHYIQKRGKKRGRKARDDDGDGDTLPAGREDASTVRLVLECVRWRMGIPDPGPQPHGVRRNYGKTKEQTPRLIRKRKMDSLPFRENLDRLGQE